MFFFITLGISLIFAAIVIAFETPSQKLNSNKKVNLPKKDAGRNLAARLKNFEKQSPKDIVEKLNGNYMSVDRDKALKKNWDKISNLSLPSSNNAFTYEKVYVRKPKKNKTTKKKSKKSKKNAK